jgi:LDH2 family malate/lactate/ureidoglycolate dehydrogenase
MPEEPSMILERFTPRRTRLVTEAALRRTTTQIFEKLGVSPDDAAEAADVLVMTDLRGVETHGVSNMLRAYVRDYRAGKLDARPGFTVEREAPGTAVIDAGKRLGIIVGPKAMRLAMMGAQGFWARPAQRKNFGAINTTRCRQRPTCGRLLHAASPRVPLGRSRHANPSRRRAGAATALPDAATSAIAGQQIRLAMRVGLLPSGWVTDKEGNLIMEEKPPRPGRLLPGATGGTREQGSHKGYGFALMAEVLSTLLAGALPTMLAPGSGSKNQFAAYNIEAFTDLERFKDTMDEMLRTLRTAVPAPGPGAGAHPAVRGRGRPIAAPTGSRC